MFKWYFVSFICELFSCLFPIFHQICFFDPQFCRVPYIFLIEFQYPFMIDVAKLFFPTLSLVFDFAYGLLSLKYIKIFYGQVYHCLWILNPKLWSLYLVIVVQLLSCVWLFETPWITAHQASLSSTIFWSLLEFMSIESVMLTTSSSAALFSFYLQSFPASRYLPMSWLFTSGCQNIGASTSLSFQWIFRVESL